MILMKQKLIMVLVVPLLVLGGCTSPTTAPDKVSVHVGIYPFAYLTQAIGQNNVEVTNLTTPGAEPHDLELTAQQIAAMAKSDLVIYEAGLQPAVDAAIAQAKPSRTLETTTVVPLEVRDGTADPHIWLDPTKMLTLASTIATQLSAIDPANQASYSANLAALSGLLGDLDRRYQTGLANCARQEFITTHAAFGYLASRYGLVQIPIAGMSPDAEPGPDDIARIETAARDKGLTTVFFETLVSPELAQSIAADVGLTTDVLDPIEGITAESRGSDYGEVMASNLEALRLANGCQ